MKVLLALAIAVSMSAQAAPDAASRCRALKGITLEHDGTIAKIWGPFTTFVADEKQGPAYCGAVGYVVPNVGFEIRLPAANWNGKLLAVGCGGDCGYISAGACRGPLERGYACIATDTGHRGQGGVWAYNDVDALIDFGYRAIHVVAAAGKDVVKAYYGSAPAHSYFYGCSTGGRQALVEAQRFPWDFDGIIAGAPWINDSDSAMNALWAARALRGPDGKPLLSRADLQLIHDAATQWSAAALSGAEEFDPRTLICNPERPDRCLTPVQAEAVRKVYEGPTDSTGRRLTPGGAAPGSELNWIDHGSGSGYIDADGGPAESEQWATTFFRYMVLPPAGPNWSPRDFDFDTDYKRFASGTQESLTSAANPDLRRFRAAGGKLIIFQGWNDESAVPPMTIDYYQTVVKVAGEAAARDFVRLYLVPGMNHCGGGEGAFAIDYLTALEAWVERKTPPDELQGVHPKIVTDGDTTSYAPLLRTFPVGAADTAFTRPVRPFSPR